MCARFFSFRNEYKKNGHVLHWWHRAISLNYRVSDLILQGPFCVILLIGLLFDWIFFGQTNEPTSIGDASLPNITSKMTSNSLKFGIISIERQRFKCYRWCKYIVLPIKWFVGWFLIDFKWANSCVCLLLIWSLEVCVCVQMWPSSSIDKQI